VAHEDGVVGGMTVAAHEWQRGRQHLGRESSLCFVDEVEGVDDRAGRDHVTDGRGAVGREQSLDLGHLCLDVRTRSVRHAIVRGDRSAVISHLLEAPREPERRAREVGIGARDNVVPLRSGGGAACALSGVRKGEFGGELSGHRAVDDVELLERALGLVQ
jgi:hypothetical protein